MRKNLFNPAIFADFLLLEVNLLVWNVKIPVTKYISYSNRLSDCSLKNYLFYIRLYIFTIRLLEHNKDLIRLSLLIFTFKPFTT